MFLNENTAKYKKKEMLCFLKVATDNALMCFLPVGFFSVIHMVCFKHQKTRCADFHSILSKVGANASETLFLLISFFYNLLLQALLAFSLDY